MMVSLLSGLCSFHTRLESLAPVLYDGWPHLGELFELQDVRLARSGQDPLSLSGHVLILLPNGLQVAFNGP